MIDGEHWSDDLADALALAQAVRDDRTGDVAVLLRHANPYAVALTLAKLLGEAADEGEASPEHVRHWAAQAVNRP
jgi:hypothetical protein